MKLKIITGMVLTVFLASMLTLAFNIQPIEANIPEGEPQLIAASKMPELESFFRYKEPWLGSDAAYSLNISEFHPNTILWTFGDTLWGRIENETKVWNMTNNSIALYDFENETIGFYHDEPKNVFEIAEWVEGGWLWGPWALAPFFQNGKIYWFLMVIDFAGWTYPIGDWLADIYLAEVDNPEDNPESWNINYYPIDFLPAKYENHSFLWLATDVYIENNTCYMYGVRQEQVYEGGNQMIIRHYVVARTQENITNFNSWEFYDGENWTSTPQIVENGPSDLSTEYSVDYLPPFDKYLLIYQNDQAEDRLLRSSIWGRWADTPIGPWSEPQLLYTPPELDWNESYYAYAIKAHYPYLSKTDKEVVASYVLRSYNEEETLSNPILYCPYFVKLTFQQAYLSLVTLYKVHLDLTGDFYEGNNLVVAFYDYQNRQEANTTVWSIVPPEPLTLSIDIQHPLNKGIENATLLLTDDHGNIIRTVTSFLVRRSHLLGRLGELDYLWTVPGADRTAIMKEYVAIDGQWPYAPS